MFSRNSSRNIKQKKNEKFQKKKYSLRVQLTGIKYPHLNTPVTFFRRIGTVLETQQFPIQFGSFNLSPSHLPSPVPYSQILLMRAPFCRAPGSTLLPPFKFDTKFPHFPEGSCRLQLCSNEWTSTGRDRTVTNPELELSAIKIQPFRFGPSELVSRHHWHSPQPPSSQNSHTARVGK